MKRVLAERGLTISRSDLYDLIQDSMGYNLELYLKTIILRPGLRIIDGAEFSVTADRTNLYVPIGAVVFPDYGVFVPDVVASSVTISLSDINSGAIVSGFNVWVVAGTEDSHYMNRAFSKNMSATVRRRTIKIVVTSAGITPGINSYLIATGEFSSDGSINITQNAWNNVLMLVPTYRAESWDLSSNILPAVTDVTAVYGMANSCKALSFRDKPINNESLPHNARSYFYADVSWPNPGVKELEAMGGLAYYQVKATPVVSGVAVGQKSIVRHLIFTRANAADSAIIRAGVRVPLDWGVSYEIRVYRVTNDLNLVVSAASDPVFVNSPSSMPIPTTQVLDISYAYSSSDMLLISHNSEYSGYRYQKAYACEYDGGEPTSIADEKYLFYVGAVQELIYEISDKNRTSVKIRVDVFNEKHFPVYRGEGVIAITPMVTDWEEIIPIPMPDSVTGWPGDGTTYAANFTATSDVGLGMLAPVLVEILAPADLLLFLAQAVPGRSVIVAGTGDPLVDGVRTLREVGDDLYGVGDINAVLDIDYHGALSEAGRISFPLSQVVSTFSRANPFIINRMSMRGILSDTTNPIGAELLVNVASFSGYSYDMVVGTDGQGDVALGEEGDIIAADEDVVVTLSLETGASYNASGLVLLLYIKEIK